MLSYKNKQLLDLMFADEALLYKELKVIVSRAMNHKKEMIPIKLGNFLIKYHSKDNCDYLHIKGYYMPSAYLSLEIMVSDIADYVKLLED